MLSFLEPTLNFGFEVRPGIAKIQNMLLWSNINSKITSIALPAKLYSTQLSLWFFFLSMVMVSMVNGLPLYFLRREILN